jgi:RNA polymerase sigma-70 factor (ECF subfamily)
MTNESRSAQPVAICAAPAGQLQALAPQELDALRRKMVAFARRTLHDQHAAEDAVADTLLALLEAPAAFRGEAQLQTYAIGVLKHKIVDTIRGRSRETVADPAQFDLEADGAAGPELALQQSREVEQFWRTLRAALATLPERLRTTFWLRDVVEWDTRALCEHLGVTEGHAHVLIHRARRQLRAHWPAPDTAPV